MLFSQVFNNYYKTMIKNGKIYLSPADAIIILGWRDRRRVLRWIKNGKFEGFRTKGKSRRGDYWWVSVESIEEFKNLN